MVQPVTMKTEMNFKYFVTFKELLEKLVILKIAAQIFESGDFLNIFLRF